MSDEEIDPKKSIVAWTTRHRNSPYLPRKNQKIDGIDLTTGGPQWEPFEPAIKKAHMILDRKNVMHRYHYTSGSFTDANYPEYFQSLGICKPDGTKLGKENFVPGVGATQLYAATVQSVLKKDDVLVVPVPTYGFFLEPKNLKGKRVVPLYLRPEDNYRLTPEQFDNELDRINKELATEQPPKKVTAFLHINPHNPTGIVNNKEDVEKLATVIKKHDLRLVIDDMAYMGLEFGRSVPEHDNDPTSISHEKVEIETLPAISKKNNEILISDDASNAEPDTFMSPYKDRIAYPMAAVPGMFDKTLTITSLSKAYNLVDLRAGLAVGPSKFIESIIKNIKRNVEFSSSIPQAAMYAVFDPENKKAKEEYLAKRANSLAIRQYGLRVFINGWDNDKEASAVWHNSKDEFLGAGANFGRVREEDKFEDTEETEMLRAFKERFKKQIEECDKKEQEINANEDLLDEARPYLLNPIQNKRVIAQNTVNNRGDWKIWKRWFDQEKKKQKAEESLMETGIPGIKTVNSVESGFFMLLDATDLKGKYIGKTQISNASDFTQMLSKYKGVYLIPGTAMGYPGDRILLRLSFPERVAQGVEEGKSILDGLIRIREFTEMLKDHPGPMPAHHSPNTQAR